MSVRLLQRRAPRVRLLTDADLAIPGQDLRTAARPDRPADRSARAGAGRDHVDRSRRAVIIDPRPGRIGAADPAGALPPHARAAQRGDVVAPTPPLVRA